MKIMIFTPFSKLHPKPLETPLSPLTTTGGHHKPPLLADRPPHWEEHFNWSRIFRIHPKDSVENEASNPFFHGFFEVTMIVLRGTL